MATRKARGLVTTVNVVGGDVSILMTGEMALFDRLDWLRVQLKDMRVLMAKFGEYLVREHIPGQFKAQGTPRRWAPLSARYAAWKRANYGNLPILILSGRMSKGFTYEAHARTLVIVNRVTAGQSDTSTPRWVFHQFGQRRKNRPMLQIGKRDHQRLQALAREYLAFEQGEGVGL